MVKFFMLSLLILFLSAPSYGQVQIGFKLAPAISASRVDGEDTGISKDGSGIRFTVGPVFDFMINKNENYFFSTGIWFSTKRVGIQSATDGDTESQSYNVQYIQLPMTLKLKSQEIALDKRIYVQFGPTFDFAVASKQKSGDTSFPLIDDFSFADVGLLMGAGLEWHLGNSTRLSTGFSYSRGLVNVMNQSGADLGDFTVKNDLFSLDLIVIF